MSLELFIKRAALKFGDKYDYSKINYKNMVSKVTIVCPKHGEFLQTPRDHINGNGCHYCSGHKVDFIERAKSIHGNRFDYSLTKYKNNKTKVTIICKTHGKFDQFPNSHLKGNGCPKCHLDSTRKTTDEFINQAIEIHGNKYDYSKSIYLGALHKVTIICPKHGEFSQIASDHINGKKGCLKCHIENKTKNKNDFIKESKIIHDNKYDYSLTDYVSNMNKVKITCPEHGIFTQRPYQHTVKKHGCPQCPTIISKPHQEIIDYIKSIYDDNDIIINDRKTIQNIELDIYIPSIKLAIEYNGTFWHSYNRKESQQERNKHAYKTNLCDNKGINLFQIWEYDWLFKNDLIKSMISGKLSLNNRIYARKCTVANIDTKAYRNFLQENHLQGYTNCHIKYGLYHDKELVCVIGFSKHKSYEWELSRFASKRFTNVIGGAGKLLNEFIKNCDPKSIFSYASRDHSNGNMYKSLGFITTGVTKPGYFYTKNLKVFSRQQFQKHKLPVKLNKFNKNISESDNMFNNGYRRIWNSGNLKYIKII